MAPGNVLDQCHVPAAKTSDTNTVWAPRDTSNGASVSLRTSARTSSTPHAIASTKEACVRATRASSWTETRDVVDDRRRADVLRDHHVVRNLGGTSVREQGLERTGDVPVPGRARIRTSRSPSRSWARAGRSRQRSGRRSDRRARLAFRPPWRPSGGGGYVSAHAISFDADPPYSVRLMHPRSVEPRSRRGNPRPVALTLSPYIFEPDELPNPCVSWAESSPLYRGTYIP